MKQENAKLNTDQKANNNKSNQLNANKRSSGTNLQYDKKQGNRGKQMNPNQIKKT